MAIQKFTEAALADLALTDAVIADNSIDIEKLSNVNLNIAPEVLEIQVAAPAAGQDTQWLWTWLTSSLPYARRTITNSPEISVPLYRQGTYTVNNYAAYDLFDDMTQTHSLYLKWIDGAGTDNLIDWAVSTGPVSDSHPDINGGNATDVQRINISVPATITLPTLTAPSVSYTVTNNGTGAYTFSGAASGDNPNLGPFYRGGTYTININAVGHPFYFTTDNGTNFVSGTYFGEYTSGVTGSRTDNGTITFTVPNDAPDTLYYQCGNHGVMRGAITVKDLAVETNINGNPVVYFQHTQEGHKTPVELRPIPSLVNQMCLVYDATTGQFVPQDLATYVENTPSFENKIREVAGTAELVVEDGSAVIAKVNVYDDSTYLPLVGNNPGDQAFATDTDILYIWDGSAWQQAGAANTDDLAEGTTNLFYTDARVGTYLSANGYDTATNIVASITDSAPATLDTLNELAAALGDDPNFATTVSTNIGTKVSKSGDTMTGTLNIESGGQLRLKGTSYTHPADNVGVLNYDTVSGNFDIDARSNGGSTNIRFSTSNSGSASTKMFIRYDGNVGIGTADPNYKLQVNGDIDILNLKGSSGNAFIRFTDGDASADWSIGSDDGSGGGAGSFIVYDRNASAYRLAIKSNGNVGIGTPDPDTTLDVRGSGQFRNTNGLLFFTDNDTAGSTNVNGAFIGMAHNAGYHVTSGDGGFGSSANSLVIGNYHTGGGDIILATTNSGPYASGRVIVKENGNIGIGTDSPSHTLHIESSGVGPLLINSTNNNGSYIRLSSPTTSAEPNHVWIGAQGNDTKFYQNNSLLSLIIKSDGKVGIGTASPGHPLHVYSTSAPGGIVAKIESSGNPWLQLTGANQSWQIGSNATGLQFYSDTLTNYTYTLKSNGYLGINETSPAARIDIKGDTINKRIHGYIDPRGVGDGTYDGYLLVNIAHSNPGTSGHPSHKFNGEIYADRGNTGSGNSFETARIVSSTAWTDDHLYVKVIGRSGQYFRSTHRVEYNGVDYHAIYFGATGGGPTNGIYYDGWHKSLDSNCLTMKRSSEVSNVRDFGHIDMVDTGHGSTVIGTGTSNRGDRGNGHKLQVFGSGIRYGHSTGAGGQRSTIGWWDYQGPSSAVTYLHLKTSLWCGGSGTSIDGFSGNSQYTMSWFNIHGYTYSPARVGFGQLGFHNWSGSIYSFATNNTNSSLPLANNAYRSADGHVVLVINFSSGAYAGCSIDYHQLYAYPTVDIRVTEYTTSGSNSGVY